MKRENMDRASVVALWEIRIRVAYNRGYRTGWGDAFYGSYRPDPLSGEWAGESVPELLGDLYSDFDFSDDDDVDAMSDLCDSYLAGYETGHGVYDESGEIRAAAIREICGDLLAGYDETAASGIPDDPGYRALLIRGTGFTADI